MDRRSLPLSRQLFAALCGAVVALALPITLAAQPFSAQIQAALRAFLAGNQTISGNWTCTGSCSGFGGVPGGSNTQVQFNDGGSFGGDSGLTWDKANNQLSLGIYPTTPSKIFVDYGILRQYGETSEANIDAPIAAYLQLGADATNSTVSVATTVQATLEPFGDNDLVDLTFYNTEPIDLGGSGVVTQLTGYRSGAGVDSLNSAHAIATYFSFRHSADVTGPGTIYAFYSAQNVGTNRWAFYGAGTAQNFFGGDTVIGNGKAIKTDTTTAHTAVLQAYDVDGAAYKTFLTLTNGNTPDMTIAPPAGATLTLQGSTYKSSDGSSGVTVTNCTSFKNGLCVAGT